MSENMKPSGISWVGDIPVNWNLTRLQTLFQNVKAKNIGMKNKNLLSLSYGKIVTKDIEGAFGLIPENYDTYNIVKKRDIVLRLTDMQNDHVSLRTGLVQEVDGIITSAYVTLRAVEANSSYYHWYLYAFDITKEIYSFGQGVRQNLTYEELKKMLIPVPLIAEQTLIANFLDEQCEKIDGVTADIEKQIEVLQKYKKSLITETVTKGLDKSVPMKDSGIEWIGEIPEHWCISKIKYNSIKVGDGLHGTPEYSDEPYYFINGNNLGSKRIEFKDDTQTVSEEEYLKYRIKLTDNTVLISLNGTLGNISYYNGEKVILGKSAGYIILENSVCKYFSGYFLSSSAAQKEIELSLSGTTINNLSLATINNLILPCPPVEEQNKIANYLDQQCSKIDSIIESKKEQLTKITQHKKSLIYEYVTGKKRVKGAKDNGN